MNVFRRLKRYSVLGVSVCAGYSLKWVLFDSRVFAVENDETENSGVPGMRLKHVQVVFRHGARTPLHLLPGTEQVTYPVNMVLRDAPHTMFDIQYINIDGRPLKPSRYDIHYEKTKLKGGSTGGLLTSYGQDQMYMLGKRLKRDYLEKTNFLDSFDPNLVKLRTTHMKRTKDSLRCVLAGLFGAENLRKNGPVIVVSSDDDYDLLVPSPNVCPVFRQINHSAMVHGADLPEFKEDRALVEKILGEEHYKKKGIQFIFARDDLVARKTCGLPMPDHITPDIYSMVDRNATKLMYYAQCGQHEAERMLAMKLSIGRFIKLILDNVKDTARGDSKVKMEMYSAHDSTVLPILAVLGLDVTEWPPFGADIIFELYEDADKRHYIKVLYLGKPQIIRGSDNELCPLEQFLDSISPYQTDDEEYEEVCHSNILEEIAKEMLEQEVGEVEDEESKESSDYAAGL